MKIVMTMAVILLGLVANAQQKQSLNLTITGMKSTQGKLMVSVFSTEDNFLKTSVVSKAVDVSDMDAVLVTFDELEEGTYALSVYQDVNENGKLDTNFMGIPTEKYGFSNDAPSRFGPASFADAKFELTANTTDHSIKLN